ncbi:MAG TPA: tRNA uridine-5-carboxymethylaminomethyl(34) synthesis GTPase MnmE [Limnochordia bacterium]|nr:tRNA uridine-5-carboxymethylaminomethyl(34) synthesis GTPase MnmE [Limnochordia bacterium]
MGEDTIAAVATPLGEGGIGIIRLSGPQALAIADEMFRRKDGQNLLAQPTYTLRYGKVVDPKTGRQLDEAIVLVMRAPHSYTAEDVVEIQCHGGVVVIREVLNLALELGARLAEPGEFTKRAFLNGRLDLAQAEAVLDLIQAQTRQGLEVAVDQLEGSLSRRIGQIRERLYDLAVRIEASIDFPEDDLPDVELAWVERGLRDAVAHTEELLATADEGKILREGLKTVITGKPNVGKSSLLNTLLNENRALVTDIPGTTRDTIEEVVNLRGVALRLIDTAGIRESSDLVERLGVERSLQLLQEADLVLHVLDRSEGLSPEDFQILELTRDMRRIVLVNKTDLPPAWDLAELGELDAPLLEMSLLKEPGRVVTALSETILGLLGERVHSSAGSRALVTRARHKQALQQAKKGLEEALNTLLAGLPLDLVAVDLYHALEALGEITGETVRENVLDRIFAEFCIGK